MHFCVLPVTAFAFASVCDPCTSLSSAAPLAFMCVSVRQQKGNRVGGSAGLACGKIRVRSVLLLAAEKAIAIPEAKAKANAAAADEDDEDKRNVWG